ncbi:MAG: hypothetical protein HYW92_03850 [Nitrosarchaeum sp.]|nr:hypothetical protein [Nitrosarchaeum sp.]
MTIYAKTIKVKAKKVKDVWITPDMDLPRGFNSTHVYDVNENSFVCKIYCTDCADCCPNPLDRKTSVELDEFIDKLKLTKSFIELPIEPLSKNVGFMHKDGTQEKLIDVV